MNQRKPINPIKMDRKQCFPTFFAVKDDMFYKIYQTEIYQSFKSLGFPASVLWPVDDVTLTKIRTVPKPLKKNNTFAKRWNSNWYKSCSWTHTGKEVEMHIEDDCLFIPVLNIDCDPGTLPFNSAIMKLNAKI
jgi:hypothetical protein